MSENKKTGNEMSMMAWNEDSACASFLSKRIFSKHENTSFVSVHNPRAFNESSDHFLSVIFAHGSQSICICARRNQIAYASVPVFSSQRTICSEPLSLTRIYSIDDLSLISLKIFFLSFSFFHSQFLILNSSFSLHIF